MVLKFELFSCTNNNISMYLSKVHHNQLQNFIEARLKKQQEESKKDSQWLSQQEDKIKKRLSVVSLNDVANENVIAGKPPIAEKPSQPKIISDATSLRPSSLQELDKNVESKIDRKNDSIYCCTTNVMFKGLAH